MTGPVGRGTAEPAGAPRERIAVVYDVASFSPFELVGSLSGHFEIVWVTDLADPRIGSLPRLLARLGPVVDDPGLASTTVPEQLRAAGARGVVAFSDTSLRRAALIAECLDLDGNAPSVVDRLTDKYLQRQVLAQAGIAGPGHVVIPSGVGADTGVELASGLGYPLVVKPCRGVSSRSVRTVSDPVELRAFLVGAAAPARADGEDFLAEQYLPDRDRPGSPAIGSYVSVESVVQHGRAVPLAITGKFALAEPFRETGNFLPHALDATDAAEVLALSMDAAAALEVTCGALHTEIKLTPDGPRIIEVNGRVGGGGIDSLYTRRTGRSLIALAAGVAVGRAIALGAETPSAGRGPFAYEFFAQAPVTATRLRSVARPERIIGTAGVFDVAMNKVPGDVLDAQAGSQEYVLRASGDAPDLAALAEVPARILEAVAMDVE